MKRLILSVVLGLMVAAWGFGQADWQGKVKKHYDIDLPRYKGQPLMLMQMVAHKGDPPIEGYTVWYRPADAKPAFEFYKNYLMRLGFKPMPTGAMLTKGQERADLYWPEKNWNGVVMYTPYPDNRVSFAISFSAKKK